MNCELLTKKFKIKDLLAKEMRAGESRNNRETAKNQRVQEFSKPITI